MLLILGRSWQLRRPLSGPCALFLLSAIFSVACRSEILFSAKVLGPVSNIYALDPGSGDLRKITDNILWRDLDADVAADGAIVFSSNREREARIDLMRREEHFSIYLTDTANATPQPLALSRQQQLIPKFSPDGKQVAYLERSAPVRLMLVARNGQGAQALLEADDIFDFSWAPDGAQLAVALRRGDETRLRLVPVAKNGAGSDLVSGDAAASHIVSAQWSPDGKKIAFIRHPLQGPGRALWVFELENGGQKRVSAEGQEVQQPTTWSADGGQLLYAALVEYRYFYDEDTHQKVYRGAMHIFESNLNGAARQVTRGEGLHKAPVYSPDGERIAFLFADRLGARSLALRIAKRDGGEIRELYPEVAQRSALRWR